MQQGIPFISATKTKQKNKIVSIAVVADRWPLQGPSHPSSITCDGAGTTPTNDASVTVLRPCPFFLAVCRRSHQPKRRPTRQLSTNQNSPFNHVQPMVDFEGPHECGCLPIITVAVVVQCFILHFVTGYLFVAVEFSS